MREPLDLIVAFVAHHLTAGADRITLFFDDPGDPAADVVDRIDGVEVVRCTPAYWTQRHPNTGRPASKVTRQITNFRHACNPSDLDWLAHIDADEFLHAPNGISPILAARPRKAHWIRLPVAERIGVGAYDPADLFGGPFRIPLPARDDAIRIYGHDQPAVLPLGMAGHAAGKPLVPTNRRTRPNIHSVWHKTQDRVLPHSEARGIMIYHFEGYSPRHWSLKQLRQSLLIQAGVRTTRKQRLAVTTEIARAQDPLAAALAWFDRTHVVSPDVATALNNTAALLRPDLDIVGSVARHFPNHPVAFTGAALDAHIEDDLQSTLATLLHRRADPQHTAPR